MIGRSALVGIVVVTLLLGIVPARAQNPSTSAVGVLDANGGFAGHPLNETLVLVPVRAGLVAPATIRPIYDADARTASGLATWGSGGSVSFTSADCSTGAHIATQTNAGLRATSQVEVPNGILLYVGEIGMPRTVDVRSILYGSGCTSTTVRQNGLVPVIDTLNLTRTHPPPLSIQ
jgi:hypothetical protein